MGPDLSTLTVRAAPDHAVRRQPDERVAGRGAASAGIETCVVFIPTDAPGGRSGLQGARDRLLIANNSWTGIDREGL
jgi:hypothetical protein